MAERNLGVELAARREIEQEEFDRAVAEEVARLRKLRGRCNLFWAWLTGRVRFTITCHWKGTP